MPSYLVEIFYLFAAVCFVFSLKMMSKPKTARMGNFIGAFGMFVAIIVTLLDQRILSYELIGLGMSTGVVIGVCLAYLSPMTGIPQVVAVLNGLGGGASALAVGAVFEELLKGHGFEILSIQFLVAALLSGLIGGLSFTGSFIAFAKLQELMTGRPILYPGRHVLNATLFIICIALFVVQFFYQDSSLPFWLLFGVASLLGISLILPIGGADMPVVIALLNSYSGLAAAGHGWGLNNSVLIVGGSLVGAAGFILTVLMCKAMNRSIYNIMFSGFGTIQESSTDSNQDDFYEGKIKKSSADEIAMLLEDAKKVIIVPGYGMAVAQAQHVVYELCSLLQAQDTEVLFAIHPVAGRMPGHMNVLLAEANVPYALLKDITEINNAFKESDVTFVLGANDVVNPLARDSDPSIPIAGMPILNADQSRAVVVVKRSLSPGYSGIDNPLFINENTLMYFKGCKEAISDLILALKEQ